MNVHLLHHLILSAAHRSPEATAIASASRSKSYEALAADTQGFAAALVSLGLARSERVGVYLDKRFETVAASFGACAAGGSFVPINPILKPEQVAYILRDCNVRVLVTSNERLDAIANELATCPDVKHVVVAGEAAELRKLGGDVSVHRWNDLVMASPRAGHRVIDIDLAAIFYTSGSTGKPKGVMLSHRNLVVGAASVASYLQNNSDDTLLAALPLSFDAGFSQLTTAFHSGARVVLLNHLFPRDVLSRIVADRVTGLTAVPPLWIQLADLEWPNGIDEHLRYIANTGGRMPLETLSKLRRRLPRTRPYLMYGLTEAFRATYLPPEEVDRRPDSIGKAIPNAEVLVMRQDGSVCAPDEPGELVQRGALVAMGYWNDPEKTAERFKPLARRGDTPEGLVLPEIAVFSGDAVRRDAEGFLYFIGRRDEMIKTSGYRVSPAEVEEVLYGTRLVGECVAFGVPHPALGQQIYVIATPASGGTLDVPAVLAACRERMPLYMVPSAIETRPAPLPRNANGKIDRKLLADEHLARVAR